MTNLRMALSAKWWALRHVVYYADLITRVVPVDVDAADGIQAALNEAATRPPVTDYQAHQERYEKYRLRGLHRRPVLLSRVALEAETYRIGSPLTIPSGVQLTGLNGGNE